MHAISFPLKICILVEIAIHVYCVCNVHQLTKQTIIYFITRHFPSYMFVYYLTILPLVMNLHKTKILLQFHLHFESFFSLLLTMYMVGTITMQK
jgi:hypothetical protein